MTGKEIILGRIREALAVDAHVVSSEQGKSVREFLPKVGENFEDRLALFKTNSEALTTRFFDCASAEEAEKVFLKISEAEGWRNVALHSSPVLESFAKVLNAGQRVGFFLTDKPYDKMILEKCDAALTTCECLVAQTGSAVVSSAATGGRALTILPPHHVIVARREQLLPDLLEAYNFLKGKYGETFPSMVSFVTGPSRTGDIERILVLGVHGPQKVTVILIP